MARERENRRQIRERGRSRGSDLRKYVDEREKGFGAVVKARECSWAEEATESKNIPMRGRGFRSKGSSLHRVSALELEDGTDFLGCRRRRAGSVYRHMLALVGTLGETRRTPLDSVVEVEFRTFRVERAADDGGSAGDRSNGRDRG